MKITKKQPLRPRGRSEEKRQSTKNAIRNAYINGPQKEVQIIPAKRDMEAETEKKKLRVCAYCRVSTDEDTQASSYELQVQNYTRMIRENPEWEFAGIFADEGISGTSVLHREHFLEMIEKMQSGRDRPYHHEAGQPFCQKCAGQSELHFHAAKARPACGRVL